MVKDTPLLMCAEMIRQTLALVKWQTRRVVKPQPKHEHYRVNKNHLSKNAVCSALLKDGSSAQPGSPAHIAQCPYGKKGSRLWVRETFYQWGKWVPAGGRTKAGKDRWRYQPVGKKVCYAADVELVATVHREKEGWHKRPAIFMPRWASRITLEITEVQVQKVQDIGKDGRKAVDVKAEGITDAQIEHWRKFLHVDDAPAYTFAVLWDSINGEKYPWKDNCWVWVISFKRVPSTADVQPSKA